MTIPSTPSEVSYAGDGISTVLPVPFVFDTSSDLLVKQQTAGVISTITTGFTVSGGDGSTGQVTFLVAPATGTNTWIFDNPAVTQPTDYIDNDAFPAESHERALDRVTRIVKRLSQQVGRTIRLPDADSQTNGELGDIDTRKGKYLFFDAVTGAVTYALSVVGTTFTQLIFNAFLADSDYYKRTAAEISAAVIPSSYAYPPGDPRRYGAVGNGVTNDSPAFQIMVNVGHCIDIPEPSVSWLFGSTVTVPSDRTISGFRGRTKILFNSQTHSAFTVTTKSNVRFESLLFTTASTNITHWAIEVADSDDITVEQCDADGCLLFLANSSQATYAAVTDANSCHRVWARDNTIKDTDGKTANASGAICFFYTRGGGISDNGLTNVVGGIQIWGGDADPSADGALANDRKTKDISITGNSVVGAEYGIFGSMAQSSTASGNTVFDINDVGLDAEGCFDFTFSNNSVRDCTNGGMTIFSYCRGIVFSGNSVSTSNASWPLARIYNAAQDVNSKDVLFVGNTFRGVGVIGVIDNANGPCMNTNFRDNHLFNARIAFTFSNGGHIITVQDNDLYFDVAAGAAFSALGVGGNNANGAFAGQCIVRDNTILTAIAQPAGSNAIGVSQGDPNVAPLSFIENNKCRGFTNDIATVWSGANAGVVGVFRIIDNYCGAGSYARTESGAASSTVFAQNNQGLSIITPAQITASVNNYAPNDAVGGASKASVSADVLRLATDASRNITGFAGGVDGLRKTWLNVGGFDLVITNEDAASTAGNRVAAGASITLNIGEAVTAIYDGTSSRWRPFGKHA